MALEVNPGRLLERQKDARTVLDEFQAGRTIEHSILANFVSFAKLEINENAQLLSSVIGQTLQYNLALSD